MPVVVNTSPVILLDKVRKLELLARLHGTPVLPPAVVAELGLWLSEKMRRAILDAAGE